MPKPSGASAKPAALVLSPEAPYPMHGGGALRTASLLQYLAQHYDVDLVVFEAPTQARSSDHLPPGLVRDVFRVALPQHSRRGVARVFRNGVRLLRSTTPLVSRFSGFDEQLERLLKSRDYHLGLIEHFWCAPYIRSLSARCERVVLDLHNVESELHRTCARSEPWPHSAAHKRFSRASQRLERAYLPRFSAVLTSSHQDAVKVNALAPSARVIVYPNALPPTPLPQVPEEHAVAFSGNLEYHPNHAAVRFFARSIWPLLLTRWPDLQWRLIGKNSHAVKPETQRLRNTEVIGAVPDAVVELARAQAVVVPLLSGSGTRLKILEAWAAGRAVVSTHIGAEGLPVRDGFNILLRDEPAAFADAVSELLNDPERRRHIGLEGRREFERSATWTAAWECLKDL